VETNTDHLRTLVKCVADSRKDVACRYCHEPVSWFRTINSQRWVLFDRAARVGKERRDQASGAALIYLDQKGIHWHHCQRDRSKDD
jgi:hypothetical protein